MKIKTAFKTLGKDFKRLRNKNFQEKTIYLTKVLDKVKIEHMVLEPFYLYNLVKRKFMKFAKEMKFKCLQCESSCCHFTNEEFYSSIIGLYKEDVRRIGKIDQKLEGLKLIPNPNIIEGIKNIFQEERLSLGLMKFLGIKKMGNLKSFYVKIVKTLGFESNLRIIERGGHYACFYFDEKRNACKIHENKPLTCFTYPFRINNDFNQVGVKVCKECHFNEKTYNKLDLFQLNWFLSRKLSYWEYLFSIYLFLRTKRKLEIDSNNGFIIPKEVGFFPGSIPFD